MVCANRFTSRAGAERRLYTSTYTDTPESGGEATGSQTDGDADRFVPIGGAWEARAAELSTPERNPMAMVLDHESIVVGCSDGLVYR
jgi:pyrimidine and pyridine-specific 5'-nucleotidase